MLQNIKSDLSCKGIKTVSPRSSSKRVKGILGILEIIPMSLFQLSSYFPATNALIMRKLYLIKLINLIYTLKFCQSGYISYACEKEPC